ncbi:amidase [Acerihabitans sp.]|uniref:amidase n=1 Tax=Acerihabitans sp. TaxID=2811394 RepID=UPI002EDBA607
MLKNITAPIASGALAGLSAVAARTAIAQGVITCEQLVASCLERIEERDPQVMAWAWLDREQALEQARLADRSASNGLLRGIPVGVKDIIDVHGMRTGFNSPVYPHYHPAMDAAAVALIRRAGGVILGKTVTTEFANRAPGPTMNPYDSQRTPGGSSSGSAAAVADYQAMLSLGTQTSGSVIRPASYCGAVGYKPTFGEFSRVGVKAQSGSLDTLGLCARSVGDAELFRAAIMAIPYQPVPPADRRLRIAVCRPPEWPSAELSSRRLIEDYAGKLAGRHHRVMDLDLAPELFDDWLSVHRVIANFESARSLAFEKINHRHQLSEKLYQGRIRDGENIPLEGYIQAQLKAEAMRAHIDKAFDEADVILTLATAGEATPGLADTGSATFNSLWTLLYMPCISLPAGFGPAGMPLSIQLVGRRFHDEALFSAALAIETFISEQE